MSIFRRKKNPFSAVQPTEKQGEIHNKTFLISTLFDVVKRYIFTSRHRRPTPTPKKTADKNMARARAARLCRFSSDKNINCASQQ
ncbi:hypothetical protein [Chromobacterium sp. ATCC 53434]|uniref:hypothetical protein n=1 Tax=Chromobacterium sp. (strain ATCC 53434 / SC 14030) TaxID=2059672 RepID=UPI0013053AC6|nr:hypothetical protein [Chromobacterium sp. ATCC 53434]